MQKYIPYGFLISLVAALSGIYISNIYACGYSVFCYNLVFHIGQPLMYGGGALAIVFVLLSVFPKAFDAWRKFAIWFVPLAALLFIFYPNPGSGDLLAPMPEQVFQWVSVVYLVVSGIIIALRK